MLASFGFFGHRGWIPFLSNHKEFQKITKIQGYKNVKKVVLSKKSTFFMISSQKLD